MLDHLRKLRLATVAVAALGSVAVIAGGGPRARLPYPSPIPSLPSAADFLVPSIDAFPPEINAQVNRSYAGYMPLGAGGDVKMFFWYFPIDDAARPVGRQHLTMYLNGGPGCSSLVGLFQSNGPMFYDTDGNFYLNENRWNKISHVVYVDQPVYTGYSYSPSGTAPFPTNELEVSAALHDFIDRFLSVFSNNNDNDAAAPLGPWGPASAPDLTIAGESFAGQYAPFLAESIISRNLHGYFDNARPIIRLRSLFIISPWIDASRQYLSYVEYIRTTGLVPADDLAAWTDLNLMNTGCIAQIQTEPATYIPVCAGIVDYVRNYVADTIPGACLNEYDMRLTPLGICASDYSWGDIVLLMLLNSDAFRAAIHTNDALAPAQYQPCSTDVLLALSPDGSGPSFPSAEWILRLGGVDITIVTGEQDFITDAIGVRWVLGNITFGWDASTPSSMAPSPWTVAGSTVGTVASFRQLTHYHVTDAGHFASKDQPAAVATAFAASIATGRAAGHNAGMCDVAGAFDWLSWMCPDP